MFLESFWELSASANLFNAAEEVAESTSGLLSPEQFAGYAVTALWTVINLLVTYFILKRFVFKPIMKLLDKRREAVIAELEDAASKTASAKALLSEADRRIEDSKGEASAILSESRVQAERQSQSIIKAAQTEAGNIIGRSNEDAKRMHNAMLDQMRDEVADLAVSIATKVVGSLIEESQQKELSEKIMDEALKVEVKKID